MTSSSSFPWLLIDLSQTLSAASPAYGADEKCIITTILDYKECTTPTKFRVQNITMPLGIGTHLDAPAHAIPGGKTIEQFTPEELFFPLYIINCSPALKRDGLLITIDDIQKFEARHGTIQKQSFIYLYTGWAYFWNNSKKYRNEQPEIGLFHPTISIEAADLLLDRTISGIGIDTLSPDRAPDFYTHQKLLSKNILIVENLTEPKQVPPCGAFIGIFPPKIEYATESPIRAIAFVPK